jgi:Neuraminidase (sialidase)
VYYSRDRGRTWHGPYDNIPLFDFAAMTGRTDYEVTGPQSMTAYLGCSEVAADTCYRESVYAITTRDGGRTWHKGPRISRPLPPRGTGHKIEYGAMPSTVRVDSQTLVSAFRSGYTPAKGRRTGWIDITRSTDNGKTWNDTITLRQDGFDYDIGYNRQVVRPDGKVVTVYYYRTKTDGQSPTYIAATIWDAGTAAQPAPPEPKK